MSEENTTFEWKHFTANLTSGISEVFSENNLSDVTLVSDDKKTFQAHKCVLSAFSPVLKNILLNNYHSRPLIFLSGVKHQELFVILQFMYLGNVLVNHSDIDRFLWVAKDLEIKQVMIGNSNISMDDFAYNGSTFKENSNVKNEDQTEIKSRDESGADIEEHKCEECGTKYKYRRSLWSHKRTKHGGIVYSCQECSYTATQQGNLRTHQQSVH